jgi:hypothetical protein
MSDYSVHNEPDFARVYEEDDLVLVRRGDLRGVLDIAVNSLDFGSGFLDNEQVEVMRTLAEQLGIPVNEVTPTEFRCAYNGHTWQYRPAGHNIFMRPLPAGMHCRLCGLFDPTITQETP